MNKIRFDDFIKLNRGFDLPDSQIEKGEYPVVASTNIKAYHNAYKVEGPMVVTGRSGSLGSVQYVKGKCWPLNTSLYVKDFKGNNPRYVYYYLKTMHLEQYNAGVGVPTLNQNHLHSLKINIHDKTEQKRVSAILSAYDDLIEKNNRKIAILQQMAEELYKEWFVRFRFPGHKTAKFKDGIPEGWAVDKIKERINRLPFNRLYKEFELEKEGKIIVIDQSEKEFLGFHNNEPSHIASYEDPICLFGDHSCKFHLITQPFSLGENVVPFKGKNINSYYLFYSTHEIIKTEEYKRHWGLFVSKKILIPPMNLQKNFEKHLKLIHKQIDIIKKSNRILIKQRDLLLPRLMSGKLKVKA